MELGDWKGFKRRRAEARKRKRLRGIGLCCYLETTGGYPRERADITVHPQRRVDVVVGTLSSGQSHETTFAQCVAEWLGVPFDDVHVFENDTDIVKEGGGSHSARSMRMAGIVMGNASDMVIEKGKKIAAHMLETAEDDIAFAAGRFTVKGTDRSVGIFDVAAAAADGKNVPEDLRGPLAASCDEMIMQLGFPYGAHVCEVEIDPQTGGLELVRYTAVDDVGRAINPMVVHGQTHGGAAQGIGQALVGALRLRRAGPIAVGVVDGLRHAARRSCCRRSPPISAKCSRPTNRLGVRGAGEGGTTGALGAVVNAVVDALAEFGVTHIEMPVTPEKNLAGDAGYSRPRKSIGDELVRERVGLPACRLVPAGDAGRIHALVGIGVQDAARRPASAIGAGRIHFAFERVAVGLGRHRIGRAVRDQKLGFDRAFFRRLRGLEIAVDRHRRGDIGAVARQLQNIAAAEAEADRGAPVVDQIAL